MVFPKNNIPWNKGKSWPEKTRTKISDTKKQLYREGKLKCNRKLFLSREELEKLYWNENKTTGQIAAKFNVDRTTINNWLKRYGIPSKKVGSQNKKFSLTKEELHELYWNQKMSMDEIAKKCGLYGPASIHRWMRIYGIPSRPTRDWMNGNRNPAWRGGISFEPYGKEWNDELREQIRKRDNHICQECGKNESELKGMHKKLSIHHIDYNKNNNTPDNLITLCEKCHAKTRWGKRDWINPRRNKK